MYEVRCCCNPAVLIGTLTVDREYRSGEMMDVAVLNPLSAFEWRDIDSPIYVERERLQFAQCNLHERSFVAIKSDDRPLEFWHKLPGFVEAA